MALSAALLGLSVAPAAPALAKTAACGGTGSVTTATGTLPDGATYEIQCPAGAWNGTLFLYSHGYVPPLPNQPNPAADSGDPITAHWLLSHGFALAGSSYASTGWAIQQAIPDQMATLNTFGKTYRRPQRTIAWGHSLGGIITAGLIQTHPQRFTAALPMCGVLSGGVATWNTALDSAFAFQQLVDSNVQVVHITNGLANLTSAKTALASAQKTAAGRARIALGAALADTPGWYTPLSKQPGRHNFAAQERNQFKWDANVDFPFVFLFRAELEARAGGNPSWTARNFAADLARSADLREVRALYHAAHLSLRADLAKLNTATPVSADPAALAYLTRNISFNGKITMPVLTMHTTGDGLVVPENEQAYRAVVDRAGNGALLRQVFVHRAGHCAFTPAEMVTAIRALLARVNTGHWNAALLRPARMNAAARKLGPFYNLYILNGKLRHAGPQFLRYHPAPYLRPYDLKG